jgi:hypothetical protein
LQSIHKKILEKIFGKFWYLSVMKKFNKLLTILKELDLPDGKFAVYGSAPLVITGVLNDVNDFDVIISPSIWGDGENMEYRVGDFEFFNNWPDEDIDDLIDNHSFLYEGVLFVNPKKVIEYKKRLGREKDSDIWLGDEYF